MGERRFHSVVRQRRLGTQSIKNQTAKGLGVKQYVVYENYPTDAATVHVSTCWRAREPGNCTPNGKWHGPFADRESALNFAKATGRRNLRICRIRLCLPCLTVPIEIAAPGNQNWDSMNALVDTSAFISSVPAPVLGKLGVKPTGRRRVRFGMGKVRDMDYAQIWLRFGGQEIMTFALFNQEWNTPMLGVYSLNGLFMEVDPVDQRLVPIEEIHA